MVAPWRRKKGTKRDGQGHEREKENGKKVGRGRGFDFPGDEVDTIDGAKSQVNHGDQQASSI